MAETVQLWLFLFLVNSPVYVMFGWFLFRSWENFWEAIVFLIKPDSWSFLDGEGWDDWYAEAKLAIWFFAPIGLMRLELWLFGV
jgi:hypothetical protein